MRVMQLSKYYFPHTGGIESHARELSKGLSKIPGVKVMVASSNWTAKSSQETIDNIPVHRLARVAKLGSTPLCFGMKGLIESFKPDILHVHLPNPIASIEALRAGTGSKLVLGWHSDIVRQKFLKKLYSPIEERLLKKASLITVATPSHISSSSHLNRFRKKCAVVPYGIDLDYFKPSRDIRLKASLLNKKHGRFVLFVGRLVYYKGLLTLLEASSKINAKVVIIGDGPLKGQLMAKAQRNVVFTGQVGDIRPYYEACSLLVLPSGEKSEAFGIVQLEAMAFNRPVVSTRLGTGVEHANLHGKTGLTVKPGSASELIDAVNMLLNQKKRMAGMGRFAGQRVAKEFGSALMAKRMHQLYLKILSSR